MEQVLNELDFLRINTNKKVEKRSNCGVDGLGWYSCVCAAGLNEVVFSRPAKEAYQLNFQPFWSYEAIMNGRKDLIREHYLNVALFIPFGMLLRVVQKQKKWWRALAFGCAVSLLIEVMQLMLKRGTCELDDVMHNTIGAIIGYGLLIIVKKIYVGISKRSVEV